MADTDTDPPGPDESETDQIDEDEKPATAIQSKATRVTFKSQKSRPTTRNPSAMMFTKPKPRPVSLSISY